MAEGSEPDAGILAIATARDVDVIILGSGLRTSKTRLFFGHGIESNRDKASRPVAVVSVS